MNRTGQSIPDSRAQAVNDLLVTALGEGRKEENGAAPTLPVPFVRPSTLSSDTDVQGTGGEMGHTP